MPAYQTYKDMAGKWRWRLVADNGRIVSASGESFDSRSNAVRAAADAKRIAASATLPVLVKRARKVGSTPPTGDVLNTPVSVFLAESRRRAAREAAAQAARATALRSLLTNT